MNIAQMTPDQINTELTRRALARTTAAIPELAKAIANLEIKTVHQRQCLDNLVKKQAAQQLELARQLQRQAI